MPRSKPAAMRVVFAFTLAGVLALAGCGPSGPTFVEHGASYSRTTALDLLTRTDTSRFASSSVTDADALRRTALSSLHRRGTSASASAELLTKTLPSSAHGVPVYIEQGSFGATPATILVEAIGPTKGKLDTKRLWAIGSDGTILFVATE